MSEPPDNGVWKPRYAACGGRPVVVPMCCEKHMWDALVLRHSWLAVLPKSRAHLRLIQGGHASEAAVGAPAAEKEPTP